MSGEKGQGPGMQTGGAMTALEIERGEESESIRLRSAPDGRLIAYTARVFLQFFFKHNFKDRPADGAGDSIAAKGAEELHTIIE